MPFVPVARVGDIPAGKGAFIDTGGVVLAVFNAGGGRFHATSPSCPHEDGPLADGWVESGAAICPWHGYDFDLETGHCGAVPGLAVTVYPVRVVGDTVEVELP
jgi:nitrite reductase/ring-hydroxylating ferredoxin subunit